MLYNSWPDIYCDVNIVSFFFFFSSRRRHTRLQGDWSSDVCSSDLARRSACLRGPRPRPRRSSRGNPDEMYGTRSEERRVGKVCRSRWSPYHRKKKKREKRSDEV